MIHNIKYPLVAAFATIMSIAGVHAQDRAEKRAAELVGQMTLEEKCLLISGKKDGFRTCPVERLGIPEIRMADGPQGVRNDTRSTYYPCGVSIAASWNPSVAMEVGHGLGLDCRARGVGILLGPGVNIYRSALCGRNFEYFGEDPFLASEIACSYITGLQGEGVMATVKHFAANNQENLRHRTNSVVDERTLNEIYFPVFRNAVRKAKVGAVMMSYNPVNGVHASENSYLIKDVLRGEWGFDGIVMSDWLSTYTTLGCVESGLDLEMPAGNFLNYTAISRLLDNGVIRVEDIDRKCIDILSTFIRFGFLDRNPGPETELPEDNPECRGIAYRAALEGPVLLRNTGILPLDPDRRTDIAVIGPNACSIPFGGGSGEVFHIEGRGTTVFQSLREIGRKWNVRLLEAGSDGNYDLTSVGKKTVVVICAGYGKDTEREGFDRSYRLPDGQDELISAAASLSDNVIVLINSGGEVDLPWLEDVEALMLDWYPGQAGGQAAAELLSGRTSPSGRLPFTFWGSLEKNPAQEFYGTKYNGVYPPWRDTLAHTTYSEGIFLGYRAREYRPLYPFGYGLTYSAFEYSDLEVERLGDGYEVSFTVRNTGKREASETAQLYVAPRSREIPRARMELKGFRKLLLRPGESRRVSLRLSMEDFAYYSTPDHRFVTPPGEYGITVAPDAGAEGLTANITIR